MDTHTPETLPKATPSFIAAVERAAAIIHPGKQDAQAHFRNLIMRRYALEKADSAAPTNPHTN